MDGQKTFAGLFATPTPELVGALKSCEAEPTIIFEDKKISSLAAPLKRCLVGKFSHGKPSMAVFQKEFHTIGLKGSFNIGWLGPR